MLKARAKRELAEQSTKHGNGLDRPHAEAVLADDPLQADYRAWRISRKYTAKELMTYCVLVALATYIVTTLLVKIGN